MTRGGTEGFPWGGASILHQAGMRTRTSQPSHPGKPTPSRSGAHPKGGGSCVTGGGPTHDVGVREPQQNPDLRPHDLFVDLGKQSPRRARVTRAARPGSGSSPRPQILPGHFRVCPRAQPYPKSQRFGPCETPGAEGQGRRGTTSPPPPPWLSPFPSPAPLLPRSPFSSGSWQRRELPCPSPGS